MADELEHGDRQRERRLARIRAAAVQADSAPSLLAATRWLRKRLPGDERFGDPLSTAGDATPEVLARQVSALQRSSRPSVAHEVGLGALQVWQELSEAAGRGRGTEEVALLFTDLVGFSSWALEVGDEPAIDLLREVGHVLDAAIAEHDGAVVKHLGDGTMAVFEHSNNAVARCARLLATAWTGSRSRATGRACAPASTRASRASWAATTSASTSTSPPASSRRRSPSRCWSRR